VPIESQENYAYKIAAHPGEKVKVEFETLESENDEMPGSGMGKGMPPGGGEPGDTDESGVNDSQGPQRGGMRKGESGFSKPQPFNFTVELQLKKQIKFIKDFLIFKSIYYFKDGLFFISNPGSL
jgi:hypothetical protein